MKPAIASLSSWGVKVVCGPLTIFCITYLQLNKDVER